MDRKEADELAARLRKASEQYYSTGASFMGDAEYDDGVAALKAAYPDDYADLYEHSVANGVDIRADADAGDDVVVHAIPMMSLAKAYTPEEVRHYIERMTKNGATGFRLQPKLDGMSLSALYHDGRLTVVSSRGNGEEGRDMSYLIGNDDVEVRNLPESIPKTGDWEVRGELLLTHSDYERASAERLRTTGEAFESYRNANAGIANGARLGLGYHASLTFLAYRLIVDGTPHDSDEDLEGLESMGFVTATTALLREWPDAPSLKVGTDGAYDAIESIIAAYDSIREDIDIPNDGIVIKPVNEDHMDEVMGSTAHHPSSQLAFKYKGERVVVEVTGIRWSLGKQGHVTPTLLYGPTTLGTTTNDRATFHNASYVDEHDIAPGSHVIIEWAGKVIPKFIDVVDTPDGAERFTVPTECPVCGHPVVRDGRVAECVNPDCPGRNASMFRVAASRSLLDIKGMGPAVIDACASAGLLTDVASLFDLDAATIAPLRDGDGRVVGESMAATIAARIDRARTLPFERVAAALAIPGFGVRQAKAVAKVGIHSISALAVADPEKLESAPGIGAKRARAIVSWFESHPDVVSRLRERGVAAVDAPETESDESGTSGDGGFLHGLAFSISGSVPEGYANRNDLVDFIEANGGVFTTTPNASTDYMIGDADGSSSKIRKARALESKGSGIRIIPPSDFKALVDGIRNH